MTPLSILFLNFKDIKCKILICQFTSIKDWRHPSLSELPPMVFNMGLTHLGSEASNFASTFFSNLKYISSKVNLTGCYNTIITKKSLGNVNNYSINLLLGKLSLHRSIGNS